MVTISKPSNVGAKIENIWVQMLFWGFLFISVFLGVTTSLSLPLSLPITLSLSTQMDLALGFMRYEIYEVMPLHVDSILWIYSQQLAPRMVWP